MDIFDVFLIADQAASGDSRGICFDRVADLNGDDSISLYDATLLVKEIMRL